MKTDKRYRGAFLLLVMTTFFSACAAIEEAPAPSDEELAASAPMPIVGRQAASTSIPFTILDVAVNPPSTEPVRRLFTSAAELRAYFGVDVPGVDFSREWVFFYSAGQKLTGGYTASVESIRAPGGGRTLHITTRLISPGPDCVVTMALTIPYVLVKFSRFTSPPRNVQYRHIDDQQNCSAALTCESVLCAEGSHCVEGPNGPECVPNVHPCALVLCRPGTLCVVQPDGSPACKPMCRNDSDCTKAADYCTGCDCRALGPDEQLPICDGPGVQCVANPCMRAAAVCRDRLCAIR